MMNEVLSVKKPDVEVTPKNVEIALGEDESSQLILKLPSSEELQHVKRLSVNNISVRSISREIDSQMVPFYEIEIDRLLKKFPNVTAKVVLSHLASLSELSGNFLRAESFIEQALKKGSNFSQFFEHKLGTNLILQNEGMKAKQLFEKLDLNSDLVANLRLAQLAIAEKRFDIAKDHVKKALTINSLDFGSRLLAGALDLTEGNYEHAIRHFKIALEEVPNSSVTYVNLGIAYLLLGNKEKALRTFRNAVAINPVNTNAVWLYSDLLVNQKQSNEAIQVLRSYLKYEGKDDQAWERLGRAYFESKDYKEALRAFQMQSSLNSSPVVSSNIGVVYLKLGDDERAEQYFSLSIKQQMDEQRLHLFPIKTFSTFLLMKRRFKDVSTLTKAILTPDLKSKLKIDPHFCSIYNDFLISAVETGQEKEAVPDVEYLLDSQETNIEFKANLLILITHYFTLINPVEESAIKYARQALSIAKSKEISQLLRKFLLNNAMFTLIEFHHLQEVDQIRSQLKANFSKDSTVVATLGLLYLRKGDLEKGESLYKKAMSLTNDEIMKDRFRQKLNLELGRNYLVNGNAKKGRIFLEKVLKVKNSLRLFENQARQLLQTLKP